MTQKEKDRSHSDDLTGLWKEDKSKQEHFEDFLGSLEKSSNARLNFTEDDKCSYLSIVFDMPNDINLRIKGSLGNRKEIGNTDFFNVNYHIVADNSTRYELQPKALGSVIDANVTFAIEGIKLIAYVSNSMQNDTNFIIEWSIYHSNSNILTERWYHISSKTEAKCYYKKVHKGLDGITLHDIQDMNYNWC